MLSDSVTNESYYMTYPKWLFFIVNTWWHFEMIEFRLLFDRIKILLKTRLKLQIKILFEMHQWIFQLLSILFQMMTLSRNGPLLYLYQVFRWMTSFRWWRQNLRAFEQYRRVLLDNKLLSGQSLRWMTSRLWIHGNLRFVLLHKIDYLPLVKYACPRKTVACLHLPNG